MVFTPNGQKGLRTSLEDTYQRRDLVHLAAGSRVPLLRQHIWLVTLVKSMASRMRQSEALIALLGLRRIEERVRGFLELLAQDYGQPCDQGLRLNLRLTHQDIASALSTTRVTVTRVLGLLKEEGWLQLDDQRQLVISHLPR
jgi:CRP-like cAMP-binding protein